MTGTFFLPGNGMARLEILKRGVIFQANNRYSKDFRHSAPNAESAKIKSHREF